MSPFLHVLITIQGSPFEPRIWRGETHSESEARCFLPSKPPLFLGHGLGLPALRTRIYGVSLFSLLLYKILLLSRHGLGVAPLKTLLLCSSQNISLVAHKTNSCIAFYKTILAPIGRAAERLPLGNGGGWGPRNPGKRVQIASMQFGPVSFLQKLTCLFAKTYRALHGAICFTKGANCLEAGRLPGSGRRSLTIPYAPREGNKILLLYTGGSHAHHHGLLRKEEEDYKRYGDYKGTGCKVGKLVLFVGYKCEESQCQGLLSR